MVSKKRVPLLIRCPVADLGGGGWGGCIPPHQLKSNDFGRKISLHFEKSVSISGCIPPTSLNLTISAEKLVSTSVKTFFFFFFWRPPDFGRKKRSNFRKISLILGEDIRIFEVLCLKFLLSPPPKFSGSATEDAPSLQTFRCQRS